MAVCLNTLSSLLHGDQKLVAYMFSNLAANC